LFLFTGEQTSLTETNLTYRKQSKSTLDLRSERT